MKKHGETTNKPNMKIILFYFIVQLTLHPYEYFSTISFSHGINGLVVPIGFS